ncbi:spermidine synthase [Homoserinibacter sp. YIM 151385]|uniref:spermidine synthase n=1 Tax=Homoserinibacter sp. YIM 151385 TaxID=2985506 RepID=UPI0022F06097|nr:fused MFS/spermidine synthase [Homoserinibacter sp. YIM 151385]WBU37635.1 fused MFS/spermidine synthase [Homoserinibacter sp. YIM 151385]
MSGRRDEAARPTATLSSGYLAEIRPDRFRDGAYELVVDGTPQSHVDLDDPSHLFFEYIRRMGHVIDQLPEGPVTAVHLGAGALTIPRYIEATRPGSRQQVVELEPALVELVRTALPLPRSGSIRIRYGDAREVLAKLPEGMRGQVDVLVVDVFGGDTIPAHVTSAEFYAECADWLSPAGILLVNIADGTGLRFARGQAATIGHVLRDVAALADTQLLKGRRFGNVVFAASRGELPLEWMPRLLAGGPHPAKVVHGRELEDWIAGAPIATDQTAIPSPPPARSIFQTRPGSGG